MPAGTDASTCAGARAAQDFAPLLSLASSATALEKDRQNANDKAEKYAAGKWDGRTPLPPPSHPLVCRLLALSGDGASSAC